MGKCLGANLLFNKSAQFLDLLFAHIAVGKSGRTKDMNFLQLAVAEWLFSVPFDSFEQALERTLGMKAVTDDYLGLMPVQKFLQHANSLVYYRRFIRGTSRKLGE